MDKTILRYWRFVNYWICRRIFWWGNYRPKRMFRRCRMVDELFSPDEMLYMRCKQEWTEQGKIKPASIHFPDQSVNRGKHGWQNDVLLPDETPESRDWIYWGVAAFKVRDLPSEVETEGKIKYSFPVEHDPLEDNYSHAELRVYKNGNREISSKKINNTVKKEYRIKLAFMTKVVFKPLV